MESKNQGATLADLGIKVPRLETATLEELHKKCTGFNAMKQERDELKKLAEATARENAELKKLVEKTIDENKTLQKQLADQAAETKRVENLAYQVNRTNGAMAAELADWQLGFKQRRPEPDPARRWRTITDDYIDELMDEWRDKRDRMRVRCNS